MHKKIVIIMLLIILLTLAVHPAFAEGWVYGQFNTWYERSDGTRLSNGKYFSVIVKAGIHVMSVFILRL